jgi:hypothetical protein
MAMIEFVLGSAMILEMVLVDSDPAEEEENLGVAVPGRAL